MRTCDFKPDNYQELAARTAHYENFPNPLAVLRQGWLDEAVELIDDAYGDDYWTSPREPIERALPDTDYRLELGDLLMVRLAGRKGIGRTANGIRRHSFLGK